ncbi:hypothetical protein RKE29_25385 [Streptomyces sp. B1866]|uniref:hypothetical protein n=1 Tax=Streptomyces sp. B1866 TaxID=3075431 RepID=UPI00288F88F7|nr:hypothetical protein [Streptomyces sp. B1866]MDT3399924.1 hypothetical protein [Streptomyces sp. B1866]
MENMAVPVSAVRYPRTRSQPPGTGAPRRPALRLAVVASAYAAVQLAFVVPHTRHALGWDESVYVSQVDPRGPAAYFSAPRSRGISLLVAPVTGLTSSHPALRLYLVLLSAAALYAAFRVWDRLVGRGATALAALLFAGLWITQTSGPAAMPNLWVALGAVAAAGWFLRVPEQPRARWWLAATLASVTLVRTPDGAWLALPLLVAAGCVRAWRPALPALAGGLALGAAQWAAEAYVRFGGLRERLRVSSDVEGGVGWHLNAGAAWRSLDGPQLCRPCEVPLRHPELTVWWLALPLLAAAAVAVALRDARTPLQLRRGHPASALLAVACAASLAVPYLFLIDYSAPRFLMPSYALLALPVAGLALRALRSASVPGRAVGVRAAARRATALRAALGLALVLQLGSQLAVTRWAAAQSETTSGRYAAAARGLHRLGLRPPCLVTGYRALPVAYHAGCASAQVAGNNRSTTVPALLRRSRREPTALLTRHGGARPPAYARAWTPHRLPGTGWTAYLPPRPAPEREIRHKVSGRHGTMGP